jgi:5'-3' exonuclease
VLNPVKDNLILDRDKVVEVLGVAPEQVIDVMALRGDSIDNIPGAPGIGDKGSVELIQQFGSVEAVLEHASEVKRKTYRESLENNRETVLLSKELVTIHCEVPVELDLEQMRTQAPDVSACRALFNELEFTTMLKELAPEEQARRSPSSSIRRRKRSAALSSWRAARASRWPSTPRCWRSHRNRWQRRKARRLRRKSRSSRPCRCSACSMPLRSRQNPLPRR